MKLRCYYCGAPVVRAEDGCVVLCDEDTESLDFTRFNEHGGRVPFGRQRYPGALTGAYERIALFSHYGCGAEDHDGYWMGLDRANEDWADHMRTKVWWFQAIDDAVRAAAEAFPDRQRRTAGAAK